MRRQRSTLANDSARALSDYITTVFVRENVPMSTRRMTFLVKIGAHIVHAPREDSFAPGYYSVLFEDPDGTRLEINYVPGKGLLSPGTQIGGGYVNGTQNGK
jgi:hypothetical protein